MSDLYRFIVNHPDSRIGADLINGIKSEINRTDSYLLEIKKDFYDKHSDLSDEKKIELELRMGIGGG